MGLRPLQGFCGTSRPGKLLGYYGLMLLGAGAAALAASELPPPHRLNRRLVGGSRHLPLSADRFGTLPVYLGLCRGEPLAGHRRGGAPEPDDRAGRLGRSSSSPGSSGGGRWGRSPLPSGCATPSTPKNPAAGGDRMPLQNLNLKPRPPKGKGTRRRLLGLSALSAVTAAVYLLSMMRNPDCRRRPIPRRNPLHHPFGHSGPGGPGKGSSTGIGKPSPKTGRG